ncbi:hypothetical protein Btru_001114 [Bulinus truncatus]|nr:hypothetical protein Btru_001114 [Bulinus truncatus]
MLDGSVGDSLQVTPNQMTTTQSSDFECQVGDNKSNSAKLAVERSVGMQTFLSELTGTTTTGSNDFECQADVVTSDFQCQVKGGQPDGTRTLELSLLPPETSNRPANKCRAHCKSTETRIHTKMSSSASQCNILTGCTSADFQCQAGKGFWDSPHKIKVSASADFQCQASVTQLDFQCQFNENVNCHD